MATLDSQLPQPPHTPEVESLFDRLPEPLLVLILSKVGSALSLVHCAVVCQRFNKLVWQVSRVSFALEDLRAALISDVGRAARNDTVITKTVMQMSSLQSLIVEGNLTAPLSAACVHAWAMHSRKYLETLIFNAAIRHGLPEVTIQNMACCRHLKHLHLKWESNPDDVDTSSHFPSLPKFCHLQTLILEQMILSDLFVESLLAQCPFLETLTLEAISGLESPTLKGQHLTTVRVTKFLHVTDVLTSALMASVTIDAPARHLDIRDTLSLHVTHSGLQTLKVFAHSQMKLDICDPSKLSLLVLEGPPRVDILNGNVRWDLRSLQNFILKGCSSLRELELSRVWFHRGTNVRPGDLQLSLHDLIGGMPELRKLSIGPRVADSLLHGLTAGSCQLRQSPPGAFPSPNLPIRTFPSLQELVVRIDRLDVEKGAFLSALLNQCPNCTKLSVDAMGMLEPEVEGGNDSDFFTVLLKMQRHFPNLDFSIVLPNGSLDFRSS